MHMPQHRLFVLGLLAIGFLLTFASDSVSAQIYTDLHNFNCSTEGCSPQYPAILAQGRDGNLYGTMSLGGTYNYGTVFRATLDGTVTVLYTFDGNLGNGFKSRSGLTLGTDGNFYGTTTAGGLGASGTIYRVTPPTPTVTFKTLYSFTASADGWEPFAPPIQAKDGNYYGVTMHGTAYKITAFGKFTSLSQSIPSWSPAPLIQATDSKFYGVNFQYNGTVFRFLPFMIVHTFLPAEGSGLYGGLVQSFDGNLYGTTASGGPFQNASGSIFKLTLKGVLTPIHAFDRSNKKTEGYSPIAGLVEATDGNFYGSTGAGGGSCNCGVLFKLTKSGTYTVLHTFDGVEGFVPQATLLQHTNGKMYGLTYRSNYNGGVLYSLDVGLAPFAKLMITQGKAGQIVQILGQGFTGTTSVKFGTGSATFTVISDTYLTAVVPTSGTTGFVTVMTPSGTLSSSKQFKVMPVLSSFTPTSGPVGTKVTITGSGFIGAMKVTFGGVKAISYIINSGTQITATVPTGAKTGSIAVTTPGGGASKATFTVF
jgi:uncharacterized repeat protein (TIGR03803 family)